MSWRVWAKNSISRIPPGPSLMSAPGSAPGENRPFWARILRSISWVSSIAAKSR
jgi:hypothetical protein